MRNRILLFTLTLVCVLAAPLLADEASYREQRKAILLADLKAKASLDDAQMASLDTLCLALQENLLKQHQNVADLLKQIKELRKDPEQNFEAIIHLEFQIEVEQFETRQLIQDFHAAVENVLTDSQQEYLPLVMNILNKVYRLRPEPSRHGQDGNEPGGPGRRSF